MHKGLPHGGSGGPHHPGPHHPDPHHPGPHHPEPHPHPGPHPHPEPHHPVDPSHGEGREQRIRELNERIVEFIHRDSRRPERSEPGREPRSREQLATEVRTIVQLPIDPSRHVEFFQIEIQNRELNSTLQSLNSFLNRETANEPSVFAKRMKIMCGFLGVAASIATILGGIYGALAYHQDNHMFLALPTMIEGSEVSDKEEITVEGVISKFKELATMDDTQFWAKVSDFIDKVYLTLDEQVLFLQLLCAITENKPFMWESHNAKFAVINRIVSEYSEDKKQHISDIYKKLPELTYNEEKIPRNICCSLAMLSLCHILNKNIEIRQVAKPLAQGGAGEAASHSEGGISSAFFAQATTGGAASASDSIAPAH